MNINSSNQYIKLCTGHLLLLIAVCVTRFFDHSLATYIHKGNSKDNEKDVKCRTRLDVEYVGGSKQQKKICLVFSIGLFYVLFNSLVNNGVYSNCNLSIHMSLFMVSVCLRDRERTQGVSSSHLSMQCLLNHRCLLLYVLLIVWNW